MNLLEEWGEFAPKHLKNAKGKCPTRRVGKRLILEGQIPGEIIDNRPWVYVHQFNLSPVKPADQAIQAAAVALVN